MPRRGTRGWPDWNGVILAIPFQLWPGSSLRRIRNRRARIFDIPAFLRPFEVHQEQDVLHPLLAQFLHEDAFGTPDARSAGDVADHDPFVLQLWQQVDEGIDVE